MASTVLQLIQNNSYSISRCVGVILFYIVGIEYYHAVEKWSRSDCVYFITGYGIIVPSQDNSRIFTCFYALFGIIFVLSMADDFSRYFLVSLQNRLLSHIDASESRYRRAFSKIIMSVTLIGISIGTGTCFFAVNENWTAAQAFYWTIATMTTIGYGDLDVKYKSTRMFCIFFIIYNVLVFFTAISNVKEVLWELHKRDEMRASLHGLDETTRPEGDGGESTFATTQSPTSVVLLRKLSGRLFSAPASTPPSPQRGDDQQLDASAFIVQALVATGKLDQKRDVDPILRYLSARGVSPQGAVPRSEVSKYVTSLSMSHDVGIRDDENDSSHSHDAHDKAPLRARRSLAHENLTSSSSSSAAGTSNPLRQSTAVLQKFLRTTGGAGSLGSSDLVTRESAFASGGGPPHLASNADVEFGHETQLMNYPAAVQTQGSAQPSPTKGVSSSIGGSGGSDKSKSSSKRNGGSSAVTEDDLEFATVSL